MNVSSFRPYNVMFHRIQMFTNTYEVMNHVRRSLEKTAWYSLYYIKECVESPYLTGFIVCCPIVIYLNYMASITIKYLTCIANVPMP